MFGLGHMDIGPLIYGVVLFLGALSLYLKIEHGHIKETVFELVAFWALLGMHGGSMTGGMAAAIAVMLFGWFLSLKRWLS